MDANANIVFFGLIVIILACAAILASTRLANKPPLIALRPVSAIDRVEALRFRER
jgi:hypothetical protein